MPSARSLQPQDQIAHYRIVGPLGAGGMGEVYLAQDRTLERNVALKILPPELVQSEERVRRFQREAKSASSLNHPNIVTIYEIGEDEVRSDSGDAKDRGSSILHYISMELVSGETLSTKIHHDKTDLRTLLGYLAQAAEGLAKAHAAGIVHRDLKPSNIMVSKDGFTKVLDFGLAKLTEKAPAEGDVTSGPTHADHGTSVGAVLGTVGYMSPEQVRGAQVDHRSDIFSFGCILYEAATRTKPFVADSNVETMHKILHDKPTPVEEIDKTVPTEVRRLIRRCLAKSPDQRFQSAKDLAIELREIVDEYDALTASGSSGSGSSALAAPTPARRGVPPIALVGIAAVVVVGIAAAVFFARRSRPGAEAIAPAVKVSTVTNRGLANGAAISPDGRYLAYSQILDGKNTLWVRQVATGSDVQILPPQKVAPQDLVFTPDGNYLYYSSADPDRDGYTAIFAIPALGGTPQKRAYDADTRVAFSPDGKQIVFRRGVPHKNRDDLVIKDLEKNQERVFASVTGSSVFGQPAWSPDGKKIAAIVFRGGVVPPVNVSVYSVADGQGHPLGTDAWPFAADLVWLPDGTGIIVSTLDPQAFSAQLRKLSYPGGQSSLVIAGSEFFFGASITTDGKTLAAVRGRQVLNLWSASAIAGRAVRQITFGSVDGGSIQEFSPNQDSLIAFSALQDGTTQVLTVGADGANARSLTSGPNAATGPFWRGNTIFYMMDGPDKSQHIWRMDEHGENAKQLTTGTGEQIIDVSKDGRIVLFARFEKLDELWMVSGDGVTPTKLGSSGRQSAVLSPDGTHVAHIAIKDVQGVGTFVPEILSTRPGEPATTPPLPARADNVTWTPDGNGLTYLHAGNEFKNLYRSGLSGGLPQEITHFTDGRITAHRWSPDGKHLLILRQGGASPANNVWMTDADGAHAVALTDFQTGDVSDMKWSPDGRRVYFTYGETSQNVVLIRNFR